MRTHCSLGILIRNTHRPRIWASSPGNTSTKVSASENSTCIAVPVLNLVRYQYHGRIKVECTKAQDCTKIDIPFSYVYQNQGLRSPYLGMTKILRGKLYAYRLLTQSHMIAIEFLFN